MRTLLSILLFSHLAIASQYSGGGSSSPEGTAVKSTGQSAGLVLTAQGDDTSAWGSVAGTGDVVGPSSSVDSEIALFNSTTGKLIKRASGTGVCKATSGVASFAALLNADVSSSAAIVRSKLASGNAFRVVTNDTSGVMADAAAITASRALVSDANGIPTHSTVTSTELGYVSGVSSSIQTQLGLLAPLASPTFTGVITDASGSVSTPSLIFGDVGTGLYKKSTNILGITGNGQAIANLSSSGTTDAIRIQNGLIRNDTASNGAGHTLEFDGTKASFAELNADSTDANNPALLNARSFSDGTQLFKAAGHAGDINDYFKLAQSSSVIVGDWKQGAATVWSMSTAGLTTLLNLNISGLTASTALVLDGSKNVASSAVTGTELGYVSGVTSAIQTQMNLKAPKASPSFTGTIGTALTANGAVIADGSSNLSTVAPGTSGNVLTSNGTVWTSAAAAGGGSSPLTSKGDIYTHSTVDARLPVGTDNYTVHADSTATTGLAYFSDYTRFGGASSDGSTYIHGDHAASGSAELSLGPSGASQLEFVNSAGGLVYKFGTVTKSTLYNDGTLETVKQMVADTSTTARPAFNYNFGAYGLHFADSTHLSLVTASTEALGINSTQQVSIGTVAPAATAKLQVDSTTQGFLPPRMTTTQKNAISSPAEGLMVYDTSLHKLCVYTGSTWETVTSS